MVALASDGSRPAVFITYRSGGKPSITTIGVQALYTPDYQLEVEMVVRVP